MSSPFRLFKKLLIALFKITGYFFVFVMQVMWHLIHLQFDKIGEAIGEFGRGVVDAIADIFKE